MTDSMAADPGTIEDCGFQAGPVTGAAQEIERGVSRLLHTHGFSSLSELPLPDGRRADVVGLGRDGRIVIVEIKSGVADFQSDRKWNDYIEWCDLFYFAVSASFPTEIIPDDAGLILADRFAGAFERVAPERPLVAARRKSMTLRFAKCAAYRLQALRDPDFAGGAMG